eukprot:TRINITY_DN30537_c0_g1_i1.p3 TRINITY_DN30537_c0_g1~~TRINITY_DN30537_c0_g1_i1.p3  ORF type:complete len:107 (+),score=13.11 TRINITY_DN30537_c0_g1_i1:113-433(+)
MPIAEALSFLVQAAQEHGWHAVSSHAVHSATALHPLGHEGVSAAGIAHLPGSHESAAAVGAHVGHAAESSSRSASMSRLFTDANGEPLWFWLFLTQFADMPDDEGK